MAGALGIGVAGRQEGATGMTQEKPAETPHVVIVGGGFAGIGCARELAKHHGVRVTAIDRHDYQQFMPCSTRLRPRS